MDRFTVSRRPAIRHPGRRQQSRPRVGRCRVRARRRKANFRQLSNAPARVAMPRYQPGEVQLTVRPTRRPPQSGWIELVWLGEVAVVRLETASACCVQGSNSRARDRAARPNARANLPQYVERRGPSQDECRKHCFCHPDTVEEVRQVASAAAVRSRSDSSAAPTPPATWWSTCRARRWW